MPLFSMLSRTKRPPSKKEKKKRETLEHSTAMYRNKLPVLPPEIFAFLFQP